MKDEGRLTKGGKGIGKGAKRGPKNASPTKGKDDDDSTVVRKKTSLYQPAPQAQPDLPIDDPSVAPTPAEGSDGEVDGETQSDGDEQPADGYGVYLPKKPTPRNGDPPQNRFAVEPHFNFEDDEIGVREHHLKRNNKNELSYSGMDPTPNPKKFHFDQVARGLNSAKNKPEDLDEALVSEFKVHPQYGLATKGTLNPDWSGDSFFQPTDWSQPLSKSESIVFIEDGAHNTYVYDHEKPAWHNSRSNWILNTNRAFEEVTTEDRIATVLGEMVAREEMGKKPKLPQINKDLLAAAAMEAGRVKDLEARRKDLGRALKPRSLWAGPTTPQRALPYDPTKDTGNGYQTPYRQLGQPREDRSALELLANEAEKDQKRRRNHLSRIVYSPPPPQLKTREEHNVFNGVGPRSARYMGGLERNRSHTHQMKNSNFEPKQYEPQASARQSRFSPRQAYSPQTRHAPHPPHIRALQSPSQPTQQTVYQSVYQLPPQIPQKAQHQLSPQIAHQPPPPPQFPLQRGPPQQPQAAGFRTLAPAPPQQGRGQQPPAGSWNPYIR